MDRENNIANQSQQKSKSKFLSLVSEGCEEDRRWNNRMLEEEERKNVDVMDQMAGRHVMSCCIVVTYFWQGGQ